MEYGGLFLLGLLVGGFGTLIGAGGGFILMPLMLLAYPDKPAVTLTAISLAVVFCNALSGTFSYARMKRVDFKSGLIFMMLAAPGAAAGAYLVKFVPRDIFNFVFALLLITGAGLILRRSFDGTLRPHSPGATFKRMLVDASGARHEYAYNLPTALAISFAVGMASSLFGIGGGIIHVPAMVSVLNFPVHLATATSQFILMVTALVGTVVHLFDGSLRREDAGFIATVAAGAVVGAQLGAALSRRVHGKWIMRSLAIALGLAGVRILVMALRTMLSGA